MKDAFWFSHDSNARNDPKLLAIRMKYGMRGYGIYFGIIEMLRESKNYEILNDYLTIAYDLREDQAIVEDIINNYKLFVFEGACISSTSLRDRMVEMDSNRIKRSIAGRKGGLVSSSKRQANVNDCLSSKVNKSKVNKNKVKDVFPPNIQEVTEYCLERNNLINPQSFIDYYQARGWKYAGGTRMTDWRAAIRNWERKRTQEKISPVTLESARMLKERWNQEDKTND